MDRIDAHQHYWRPSRGDYDWLPKGHPVLDRTYLPADLAPHLKAQGIAGTVLVQAAATRAETDFLLGLAEDPSVLGVVGWADFDDPASFETLPQDPKLKGLRPMIQDLPDPDWVLGPHLAPAFEALIARGLTFDALGFPLHARRFLTLLNRHPDLTCILDHGLKPQIATPEAFAPWAADMARLARESAAVVKLSGLVTEDGPNWSVERLRPYVDHLLETFGPDRMIWGSDWPVVTLRCSYGDWVAASEAMTQGLDARGRAALWGGTARRIYRL
jgi:L-fuconolactonase